MASDKEAEPYMAWLVQELKKKSTADVEFRADGIKCFESSLANEEAFASKAFEEGVLLVISVNKLNEQKSRLFNYCSYNYPQLPFFNYFRIFEKKVVGVVDTEV